MCNVSTSTAEAVLTFILIANFSDQDGFNWEPRVYDAVT